MKILQVSNGYPPKEKGGVGEYVRSISTFLAKTNDVIVFTREWDYNQKNFTTRTYQDENVFVRSVINNNVYPANFVDSYINTTIDKLFQELLNEHKPHVIHFNHLLGLSANLPLIAKKREIPFIITLHDYWYICPCIRLTTLSGQICPGSNPNCVNEYFKQHSIIASKLFEFSPILLKKLIPTIIKREIKDIIGLKTKILTKDLNPTVTTRLIEKRARHFRKILHLATYLIAPSKFVKDAYGTFGISLEKIKVIPHGIDATHLSKVVKKSPKIITYAYLGTLYEFKGIEVLIRAFHRIDDTHAELKIYGDSSINPLYLRRLKKLTKNKNIQFKGAYERHMLPLIFSTIDIIVVPSLVPESFSLITREAQAAKIPVIASRIGALPEVIKDAVNGFLVKPGDEKDLAEKMKKVLQNPALIKKLSRHAIEPTSIEINIHKLNNIYKQVLYKKVKTPI